MLQQVIDRMTTNETLWFRDRYPFEYLANVIVPKYRNGRGGMRIWCAACSSGQEPYSIAIKLDQVHALSSTEIIATDLSERVLNKAKSGIYQKIEHATGGIETLFY